MAGTESYIVSKLLLQKSVQDIYGIVCQAPTNVRADYASIITDKGKKRKYYFWMYHESTHSQDSTKSYVDQTKNIVNQVEKGSV